MTLNVRNIDEKLLREFKVLCHEHHTTLRQATIDLISLAVRKQKLAPKE